MLPDFLEISRHWAAFYFNKDYKIVIIPSNQLKKYDKYSEEYYKVFNNYPEKWSNRKWSKIIKKLLGE